MQNVQSLYFLYRTTSLRPTVPDRISLNKIHWLGDFNVLHGMNYTKERKMFHKYALSLPVSSDHHLKNTLFLKAVK